MSDYRVDLERFLWKFKDIDREIASGFAEKYDQIVKTSSDKDKELNEIDVARLFEAMKDPRPIPEIRAIFTRYGKGGPKPKKLTFVKVSCAFFDKDYDIFETLTEEELKNLAIRDEKSKETEEIEAKLAARKLKEEEDEAARQAQLEAEGKLTGVAAKQAFFNRQLSGPAVPAETNEQRIKKEAALRKALKEAKKKEDEEADELLNGLTPEKAQERLREKMQKKLADDEAERIKEEEAQERRRSINKATLNAKWSSPAK